MGRIYGTFDKSESHKKEIRESHQYKDYLERHPRTKEILNSKSKAIHAKMGDKPKKLHVRHETGAGQYKGDTNERDVRINGKFPAKIYRK